MTTAIAKVELARLDYALVGEFKFFKAAAGRRCWCA